VCSSDLVLDGKRIAKDLLDAFQTEAGWLHATEAGWAVEKGMPN